MESKKDQNALINAYYQMAYIKGTFEYYMFYEREAGKKSIDEEVMQTIYSTVSHILSEKTEQDEKIIVNVEKARTLIIEKMQVLTAYSDYLQIYEYVLNRLEQKYEIEEAVDEEVFVNQLVNYVFSVKDNVVMNERIKEIVGQLPVRMTKNYYFDLIRESITLYKGGNKESLDAYIYMLRTSAMLYEPEKMEQYFLEYKDKLKEFEEADYANLTKEQYQKLSISLSLITKELIRQTDFYVLAQELLNSLDTVLIARVSMKKEEWKKESICREILSFLQEEFQNSSTTNKLAKMEELLTHLEGQQEHLQEKIIKLEGCFFDGDEKKLEDTLLNLEKMGKLMSSSIFVELDKEENMELVDDTYMESVTKQLLEDMVSLFQKNNKRVRHAVMASTLNKMPVFFHKAEEVVDYIKNSLQQCSDFSEKNVSMKLLQELMDAM